MSTETSKKTVVIDLDNTLADYIGGWEANKNFPGKPRCDVVSGLKKLKENNWIIGILTTRPICIVEQWLKQYDLSEIIDFINVNPYQPKDASREKPIAHCYIDDRGIRYTGNNMVEIVAGLLAGGFQPWNK